MELLGKFSKAVPEFMVAEAKVIEVAYKIRGIEQQGKAFNSIGSRLKVGCTNCILAQKGMI